MKFSFFVRTGHLARRARRLRIAPTGLRPPSPPARIPSALACQRLPVPPASVLAQRCASTEAGGTHRGSARAGFQPPGSPLHSPSPILPGLWMWYTISQLVYSFSDISILVYRKQVAYHDAWVRAAHAAGAQAVFRLRPGAAPEGTHRLFLAGALQPDLPRTEPPGVAGADCSRGGGAGGAAR
jgi:hypothetical protein